MTEGCQGEGNGSRGIGFTGYVSGGKAGGVAQFSRDGLAGIAIEIGDEDRPAFLRDQARHGRAQTGCGAGNEEYMILELHGRFLRRESNIFGMGKPQISSVIILQ
jgi:hypothetical protein